MAIRTMDIPECDVCGELTLPQKGPGRENPRENHKRCGKCKSPRWDWKHKAQLAAASTAEGPAVKATSAQPETTAPIVAKPMALPDRSKSRGATPCRHRKLNCPICQSK